MGNRRFKDLLEASMKSKDTEEWLDVHFTRPIGLFFALIWERLGVHPNTITIISIFLGLAAGWMFHYTDPLHNLMGVVLLMLANFCDSTDGQLARLTGQKTMIGRCLDGFAGDVWFFAIYLALVFRLWPQPLPGLETRWGVCALAACAVAGLLSHSPQSSLADYYRQIHLFFLKGREGSELDSSIHESQELARLPVVALSGPAPSTTTTATTAAARSAARPSFRPSWTVSAPPTARPPWPRSLGRTPSSRAAARSCG